MIRSLRRLESSLEGVTFASHQRVTALRQLQPNLATFNLICAPHTLISQGL